ncbi:MAG TPA: tRNA (adenosine(37)-N6)-threonylcarbamoyltransferase complex transferase subunit TsaD [Acidimicrobiia bacterium]|nr:tRNA (adenosine(37)-N6)-threonylcarbamoyltransferase complex transferase subunit TsaD [Acidimicrobiia bacterium]
MNILSIESSCDEMAAAVVVDGVQVKSSVVSSQIDVHKKYGGVVPELAGRHHLELVNNVVRTALDEAEMILDDIDLFAGTRGPGLSAALLVGTTAAKSYAYALGKDFVGIHHHEAHILSVLLEHENVEFPFISLLVSGGHTMVVVVDGLGKYRVLGGTIDDAAGEAYDKVARLLGLGYPGGPLIDKLAEEGDRKAFDFPRPMKDDPFNMSFSGLKTAVKYAVRDNPDVKVEDICASFQAAVVDSLIAKTRAAITLVNKETQPLRGVSIGGGVAANSHLRQRIEELSNEFSIRALIPERSMCTDNAVMIGVAAKIHYELRGADTLATGIDSGWKLTDLTIRHPEDINPLLS